MEPPAAVIAVSFLDPIRALITAGCAYLSRKRYGVLVAATTSAVVCETILTVAQAGRSWGQDLVTGFSASLLQALVLILATRAMRRRRAAPRLAALGQPSNGAQ
jgi:F0F1-type ATP synthase assembly protein I